MTNTNERIAFVTGSNGFVGLNLCEELLHQGWHVIALHRENSDISYLKRIPVEMVTGDILDKESLIQALPENVDAVFHVAGSLSFWYRDFPMQTAINVEGTRNMVEVAQALNAKRFIFTSSMASYGLQPQPISESSPSMAYESKNNYSINKLEAEEIVREAAKGSLSTCIIAPAGIMGPKDRGSWAGMVFMIRDGKLKGVPRGRLPMAHIKEVVKAHIAAVDQEGKGESYILAGESVTLEVLFHLIADRLGIELKANVVPPLALTLIGGIQVFISFFTNKAPDMTPGLAKMLSSNIDADTDKAERELGFKKISIETCVDDCINWLKTEKLI